MVYCYHQNYQSLNIKRFLKHTTKFISRGDKINVPYQLQLDKLYIFIYSYLFIYLFYWFFFIYYFIYIYVLFTATCDAEGKFAVDESNMCWYHECVLNAAGLQWLPRRCAWMSKVSSNYVQGVSNPCTVRIGEAEKCESFKESLQSHLKVT